MSKIIYPMLYLPKVVNNNILLFLVLTLFSCSQQNENDDYILLSMVIESNQKDFNTDFKLLASRDFQRKGLHNYYRYKFHNEHPVGIIKGYDKEKKKVIKLNKEEQKVFDNNWFKEYRILDGFLTKKEYEHLFNQGDNRSLWVMEKINNKNVKIENTNRAYGDTNSISRPIYTTDKKFAIISCSIYKEQTKLILFKKDKCGWKIVSSKIKYLL